MMNLPAIFQAMINKILRDLINKGKVTVFVDNVLVGTEMKKGHNKIVEECQHGVMKTQSLTKVVVQKELNRVPYWILLSTYTNIKQSVHLSPVIT